MHFLRQQLLYKQGPKKYVLYNNGGGGGRQVFTGWRVFFSQQNIMNMSDYIFCSATTATWCFQSVNCFRTIFFQKAYHHPRLSTDCCLSGKKFQKTSAYVERTLGWSSSHPKVPWCISTVPVIRTVNFIIMGMFINSLTIWFSGNHDCRWVYHFYLIFQTRKVKKPSCPN